MKFVDCEWPRATHIKAGDRTLRFNHGAHGSLSILDDLGVRLLVPSEAGLLALGYRPVRQVEEIELVKSVTWEGVALQGACNRKTQLHIEFYGRPEYPDGWDPKGEKVIVTVTRIQEDK